MLNRSLTGCADAPSAAATNRPWRCIATAILSTIARHQGNGEAAASYLAEVNHATEPELTATARRFLTAARG